MRRAAAIAVVVAVERGCPAIDGVIPTGVGRLREVEVEPRDRRSLGRADAGEARIVDVLVQDRRDELARKNVELVHAWIAENEESLCMRQRDAAHRYGRPKARMVLPVTLRARA